MTIKSADKGFTREAENFPQMSQVETPLFKQPLKGRILRHYDKNLSGVTSHMFEGVSLGARSNVVIERDVDGFFVASVPQLPGCHTQAKTIDELLRRIKEAIKLYLEVEGKSPERATKFLGVQLVEIPLSEA